MFDSKLPIPTDHYFKFCALFGLFLMITIIAAFTYLHQTTNAMLFDTVIGLEELKAKEKPSVADTKKIEVQEAKIKIAVEDKRNYNQILGASFGCAIAIAIYGLAGWRYKLQPKYDKLLDLQIQKAEQDLKKPERVPFRGPK